VLALFATRGASSSCSGCHTPCLNSMLSCIQLI
jgi:hypothetical protein